MAVPRESETGTRPTGAVLVLAALGVVFGDIGTSPLYAMQTVFSKDAARVVSVDQTAVYGVVSLVFWAVLIIVTLQYVTLVMSADNDGEGGIVSLIALLRRLHERTGVAGMAALAGLGIFGASMFFGDSMITPAISVLSAVEGLEVVQPSFDSLVVPITVAILILLFAIQSLGTATVGRLFGPIMVAWFLALAGFGIHGIAQHPDVLTALSPVWGVRFFIQDGLTAFLSLGGVVLAVTGAEALYADMGHFGKRPIRRAWLLAVFPALTLNYLGQGALLTQDPSGTSSPFFLLIPHWARLPMVLLATAATVIASQAVISGAFSVTRQAVQLGYLPRLRIRHTSHHEYGQIYVPFVNWALLSVVLVLVFAFQRSERLAAAYGVAACGTITISGLLFFAVLHQRGERPVWQYAPLAALLAAVDLSFLVSNLTKVPTGGWLPLVVGGAIFTVMLTWQQGRRIVTRNRSEEEGPLEDFVRHLRDMDPPVQRVPGTAVFLTRADATAPLAMRENVEHNHTLHEDVVVLSLKTLPVPHVSSDDRLEISDLGFTDDGISHVFATFGFQDTQNVPEVLRQAEEAGLESHIDVEDASYFLSKIEIIPTDAPGMALWRKRLFLATSSVTADAAEYFKLPRDRTVLMGSHIEM